jgi:hypothetical protein
MGADENMLEVDQWSDDLLNRKRYAQFLTNYIDAKVQPDKPGMVMALDASWGLGKTFFITRWAEQLRSSNHAVLVFDAWQNDSAEDPVISFMAELRAGLTPIIDQLPLNTAVEAEIKARSVYMVGNLRRATFSAAKVVGTAVVKKLTGVAVGEMVDAFYPLGESTDAAAAGGGSSEASNDSKGASASQVVIEKGLDDFFEKTLQGHAQRLQAVKDFRQSLQDLLEALRKAGLIQGPLYVFIDELDRCRPNYAISLLEGVKHLFSVQGVAFVVSTNLDQLSKAVGAVYGSSFDGFQYLKRFFDFEYELPEPTRVKFIQLQISGTAIEKHVSYSGLDTRLTSKPNDIAHGFAAIGEAMRLDLRSLSRIIASVEAVVANLPKDKPIAFMWLFFLTSLKYRHHQDFHRIANQNINSEEFKLLCNKIFTGPKTVVGLSFQNIDGVRRRRESSFDLVEILWNYCRATLEDADWVLKAVERIDPYSEAYPLFMITTLFEGWSLNRGAAHPIGQYATLISMAGHAEQT